MLAKNISAGRHLTPLALCKPQVDAVLRFVVGAQCAPYLDRGSYGRHVVRFLSADIPASCKDHPTCGAPTEDGSPCQRRVPMEGVRCHEHDDLDGGEV